MDIEFHYYITYLVAARAGFNHKDAQTIAFSAQYVDDNNESYVINRGRDHAFSGKMSQTLNILKPEGDQLEIYPVFHFIPGNPNADTAKRIDGKTHGLNTTPNSKHAQNLFQMALNENNLYQIGIACHSYVDTWAHQNFVGCSDEFNDIENSNLLNEAVNKLFLNTGHADAHYKPDCPALEWKDPRLVNEHISNKDRFLEASEHLFKYLFNSSLHGLNNGNKDYDKECASLLEDLNDAIGEVDNDNSKKGERINRYKELARQHAYGATEIEEYIEYEENEKHKVKWFQDAVRREPRKKEQQRTAGRDVTASYNYFWKDDENYTETDWYKFQVAVKRHQKEAIDYLKENVPTFLEKKVTVDVEPESSSRLNHS